MKSKYLALAMIGVMMSATARSIEPIKREFIPKKEPKKIIPKGCKEYNFTRSGNIVSETCTYIYFTCVASSERKARLKLKKYIDTIGL